MMSSSEQTSDAYFVSEYVEDLIRDYLYFRGYSSTLKAMENDQKSSRDKILQPFRIIREIQFLIDAHDLMGLRDYWGYLHKQFFSRLERDHLEVMRKIETGILRLYLTSAIREGKKDKVTEFFETLSNELQQLAEWKDWFAVPYIKGIQEHAKFGRYFSKTYMEKVMVSLHNFICTILAYMPRPLLMKFEEEMQRAKRLEKENGDLVDQIAKANHAYHISEIELQKVKTEIKDKDIQMEQLKKQQADFLRIRNLTPEERSLKLPNAFPRLRLEATRPQSMGDEHLDCLRSLPSFPYKSSDPAVLSKPEVKVGYVANEEEVPSSSGPEKPNEVFSPEPLDSVPSLNAPQDSLIGNSRALPASSTKRGDACVRDSLDVDKNLLTFYNCNQLDEAPFLFLSREHYTGHGSAITHCKVAPGGLSLASADNQGGVRVWEFGERVNDVYKVNCKNFQVLSLEWESKFAQSLFIGGNNGKVQLHSITNKKLQHELELSEQYPRVLSIACHPINNSFVLACSETGKSVRSTADSVSLSPHNSTKSTISVVDQYRLGTLTIWDWKTLKRTSRIEVQPRPFSITTTSFNHNGNLLLTGGVDGMVRLYDLSNQGCIMGWHAHEGEISNLMFSNDENSIYSMGNDGKFTQWSIQNMGQRLQDIPVEVDACIPHLIAGKDCQKPFDLAVGNFFAFDSDSDHVLTCGNPRAHVYKIVRSAPVEHVLSIGGHDDVVTCVDWSSSQTCCSCITGSADGSINVTTLLRQ